VWRALTEEDKMRKWYFPQLKKFESLVGFEFDFTNDGAGGAFIVIIVEP
jgi:uncharacterized protein YndB with AHSA1/START domain